MNSFSGRDIRKVAASISKFGFRESSACNTDMLKTDKITNFLKQYGEEKRSVNIFEFNLQIPPDATIVTSYVTGQFTNGGPSRNVAISLYEKPLNCPFYEDEYAPLMSVKWVTGRIGEEDTFETPSLNSLIQFAFDRRKQVRNDIDDLTIALSFSVQEPRLINSDSETTHLASRDTKLNLIYQPNTVRE